ncbi:MAG: hypothetical protein IPJ04_13590 [Candidatus Eisenbacteria bacterium]|nr:hypothetical protein [Candidatus Eisenbacteria bacterium]
MKHDLLVAVTIAPPALVLWAAALAMAAALLLRLAHTPRRGVLASLATLLPWAALAPLAWWVTQPQGTTLARAALAAALAVALLARDREDRRQSEAALKLAWVMGVAFALTWAGESLLALAAGTAVSAEQWPALALQLDTYALWGAALALTLLAGIVLLGGAPFHFWLADVLHGAPAYVAPLVVAALQSAGAALLGSRMAGIAAFPAGHALAQSLLTMAAAIGLVAGAATLATQRRPERRVGTLASLQGALLLCGVVAGRTDTTAIALWGAHAALALTGAGALARFLPVASDAADPPGALFRRHPFSGALGLYALLSLAGAPGTPGMSLWLSAARDLAATRHPGLLLALALAWLVGVAVSVDEARRAFGAPTTLTAPSRAVPGAARAALWCAAAGLLALLLAR